GPAAPASSITHPTSPASTSPTTTSNFPTQTTPSASPPIACVKIQPADAPTRVERLPGGYVPNRPSNASLLYRAHRAAQDRGLGGQQEKLSKAYNAEWNALSAEEKKPFFDVYLADDELFHLRFPHYQYQKGARSEWVAQARKYGPQISHDWSPENDHLFMLDENGAVVHTPSVIPVTDAPALLLRLLWAKTKTLFSPSTRTLVMMMTVSSLRRTSFTKITMSMRQSQNSTLASSLFPRGPSRHYCSPVQLT
ncbi:hypothetical protein BDZ89DRAFT_1066310, partial [Hymenopellis radicata]